MLFGAYIKELRNRRNVTQPELAYKLGNNFQNISAMERGEFTLTIYNAQKFAEAFEMRLSELFKGFEDSNYLKKD